MYNRPERPLVVKCTFDRQNKRITFSSARNCSYELLRRKVEQCFSLSHSAYAIAYRDDDGETYEIGTENDLTEAIQYFQAGTDDPPLSSAASILSGRSFGSRRITLRVQISVEYDGPSLSDTSSLASLEEYKSRNGSDFSLSLGAPSEFDEDAVTVSSRDPDGRSKYLVPPPVPDKRSQLSGESSWNSVRSGRSGDGGAGSSQHPPTSDTARSTNPSIDGRKVLVYPDSPSAVLERMKLEETIQDDGSSVDYDHAMTKDRGAAWLKEQNERTLRSMLGVVPDPPQSVDEEEPLGGDLALERDPRGKYYYAYTATGSSSASQSHEDNGNYDIEPSVDSRVNKRPRPDSRQLNWLAAQQIATTEQSENRSQLSSYHLPEPSIPEDEIPPEFLQHLPVPSVPQEELTDCSECGTLLDSIRYVCSTCGEKPPKSETDKGKGKDPFNDLHHGYPPKPSPATVLQRHLSVTSATTSFSSTSRTYVGSGSVYDGEGSPTSPRSPVKNATLNIPGHYDGLGYELCAGCIESAGVTHAIEAGLAPGSSPIAPHAPHPSPEEAQRALQWRRSAPRHKGQLRHAYNEKIWGHGGWEDVEQDEYYTLTCSACDSSASTPRNKLYKCASCIKYFLCRACYSQVHDIHPSHAFLVVPKPGKSSGSNSYTDSDFFTTPLPEPGEEQSLAHIGVKCSHCLLDIVGARFHCAICDDVDICSNCESAGLPGNLHQAEGGHTSAHIMIKIPYPLERQKVQTASKRAVSLWMGRDASSVLSAASNSKSKAVSELSYARTVMGNGQHPLSSSADDDHHMFCNSCNRPIMGIRYQCAHCISVPAPYSLCANCEERSYMVHDPMHIFFKIPRPVQRQIESRIPLLPHLYRIPVGPQPGCAIPHEPKSYLMDIIHTTALCDRCMDKIRGCWFRCAYCGIDLCDACEEVDTHNDAHVFMVFKSLIDMEVLRVFAKLENPNGSPPVIPYPIYF